MSLARRGIGRLLQPISELTRMDRDLDRLMGAFVPRHMRRGLWDSELAEAVNPAVDVKETDQAFILQAELPGMKKDDIKVEVQGDTVRLHGERVSESKKDTDRYHISERSWGSFERSFQLPETADLENIQALYKEGVLSLSIPKQASKKGTRQVQIGEGDFNASNTVTTSGTETTTAATGGNGNGSGSGKSTA